MSNVHSSERLTRASRETFLAILETLPGALFFLDDSGTIVHTNASAQTLIGATSEEVIDKPLTQTLWQYASPANHEQVHAAIARASQGETVHFEARIHPREGKELDLEATITRYVDADHHREYYIFAGIDITARKRADEAIHALIDGIPHFVWIMDPNGSAHYGNQPWRDYTGRTLEQLQGDGWLQLIHPDDRPRVQDAWQTAVRTGTLYEVEHRIQEGSTGDYRWFLARGIPQKDAQGTIVRWLGTCTDIDKQKRTEAALRQSQEQVHALMNSNIIGITITEGEQIVDANDAFLRMTGYTREDLRAGNLNWMRMTHPDYLARTLQAQQELVTRQSMTPYEKVYVCKDGSRLPVVIGRVTLPANPSQEIGFVLDNSARKELEQRKDDFISMASHELRTPLTALKMQTQLVRKRLEKQGLSTAATAVAGMERPIKQLERLTEELLDVSKIQAGRLEYVQEVVDLEALLHEAAETMQQMSTTHAVVVRGEAPCTLIGDKDRLEQVFMNLIGNAIKYSPDAHTVEIDLCTSEETATIRVHDHGLGIPREQHDKIFERFYRAAGPKQSAIRGLGMGLYIVAEIVKYHGGTITVDSAVGKGSTFTVTLPLNGNV